MMSDPQQNNFFGSGGGGMNDANQFGMAMNQGGFNNMFRAQGNAGNAGQPTSQQMAAMLQQQSMGNGAGDQQNFNFSNELKRLQQFSQFGGAGQGGNNALLAMGNQRNDASQAALLQSMLDQQKNVPRFDNPLQGFEGNAQNPMLQPAFFNDPRFLMAGQMNPNPLAMGNNMAGLGLSGNALGNATGRAGGNELPLPSPHSLFHRDGSRRMRGGVIEPFPEKLHRLLLEVEAAGRSDVISFVASGRAFAIHKPDKFFKEIVPLYFRQSRLSSFKRQLNLYGFELINTGPARGGYYHELFVKDRPELCRRMRRVAVKVVQKPDGKNDKNDGGGDSGKGDDELGQALGDSV